MKKVSFVFLIVIIALVFCIFLGLVIVSTVFSESVDVASITSTIITDFLAPATPMMIGAFVGAWTAFLLADRVRKNEQREQRLGAANRLLYALYERLNTIKLFQIDHIEPTRGDPSQMISMPPVLDFQAVKSDFKVEDISFLFQTKYKPLTFSIHILNEQYAGTVNTIQFRSSLHLDVLQPLLEESGYRAGNPITNEHALDVLGERRYVMLRKSTETVVYKVDKFIERGDNLRGNLIEALSDVFTKAEILNFELLDEPIENPM